MRIWGGIHRGEKCGERGFAEIDLKITRQYFPTQYFRNSNS
jgi:hypothetical protein